jgi:hypothetical protein
VFLFKEFRNAENGVAEVLSKELNEWVRIEAEVLKQVVRSGDIRRYQAAPTVVALFPYVVRNNTARLLSEAELQSQHPLTWSYLTRNRALLEAREGGKFRDSNWYRYGRTQNLGMWEQAKLMIPYMISRLAAYPDTGKNYYFINVTTGGYGITAASGDYSLHYLAGLLNSKLLDFFLKRASSQFRGGYFSAGKQYIEQLPIRRIDFSNLTDRAHHDRMVALVERMLALHRQQAKATTGHDKTLIGRQIEATDRQIDRLVYELYGLTEDEIRIVEGTVGERMNDSTGEQQ